MASEVAAPRQALIERLRAARRILITSHVGIDGDSAGSALALMRWLDREGKTSAYVNDGELPRLLSALPGFDRLMRPADPDATYDLGVILDAGCSDRLGRVFPLFEGLPCLVIDHHETNDAAHGLSWVDPTAASVTIMLAELFAAANTPLDLDLAYPLYIGLFMDTFSFQQTNTDRRAMEWGGRFIEAGVNPYEVTRRMFEEKSLAAVRLAGRAAERAVVEGSLAWSWLTRDDFAALGATDADTEGVIQLLRTIGGVRAVALFREQDAGKVKVTFRAKDDTNVAAVARRFGGGGHAAAAGCTLEMPLAAAQDAVLAALGNATGKEGET